MTPSITGSVTMKKLYERELSSIRKTIESFHEDLQGDYERELEELEMTSG